jgi:hypothetical protein
VSDTYFRQILGVSPRADKEEIKRAYRRLVMENHPDRFPATQKTVQELRVITLNEAYRSLMSWVDSGLGKKPPEARVRRSGSEARGAGGSKPRPRPETRRRPPEKPGSTLAGHKDPAYAYYKQGFLNFSLALHGIAGLNQRMFAAKQTGPYRVVDDVKESLELLTAAHGYFTRVVEEYPDSVWEADAGVKLRRIDRFTALYRKILSNLGAGES